MMLCVRTMSFQSFKYLFCINKQKEPGIAIGIAECTGLSIEQVNALQEFFQTSVSRNGKTHFPHKKRRISKKIRLFLFNRRANRI